MKGAAPVLVAALLMPPALGAQIAARPHQGAKPATSRLLPAIRTAVETRFRHMEANSTVRLRDVVVTPRPGARAALVVVLVPPTAEKFELHMENAYMLVWQGLMREPNAFNELGRVKVVLNRGARRMSADCPIESVQNSSGYADFTRLKQQCDVSERPPAGRSRPHPIEPSRNHLELSAEPGPE